MMKKIVSSFALAVFCLGAFAAAQAGDKQAPVTEASAPAKPEAGELKIQTSGGDVVIVRDSEEGPQRNCTPKETATVEVRRNYTKSDISTLAAEIDGYVSKATELGARHGVTLTVGSLNYTANYERERYREDGDVADRAFRINVNLSLVAEPANKTPAFVQALNDDGFIASLSVRMRNPCKHGH